MLLVEFYYVVLETLSITKINIISSKAICIIKAITKSYAFIGSHLNKRLIFLRALLNKIALNFTFNSIIIILVG